ncbi:WW/Rsp5/WWP domain protein [Beauveria brongniartii RCEF 3172]|uniref:WW/Rsp5/WWP domain protein n=1 Tax=Beauveria brongniartii RCEF 3172 TaxID=1081107 RepID=A0A162LST4_9HYPO|nr:WW/Rsp5/WWP domain protein [Beauveria brongniartii RCEF 3172]
MERKVEEVRHQTSRILHEARTWRAAHGIAVNDAGGLAWPPSPAADAHDHDHDHDDNVSLANMQQLVRRVEAAQWAEIGFLVFRTYYADEPLWERFQQRFGEVVDRGIVGAPAAAAGLLARISGRVKLPLVSDYALVDLGPGGIAHIYRDSVSNLDGDSDSDSEEEQGDDGDDDEGGHLASLDPGLRMPMCIMVDEECLRSMTGEEEEEEGGGAVPYVKAVDVRLATNKDLGYSGSFKVAVGRLMSHFYAALQFYEPVDISAAVDKSTGIWTDMGSVQPSNNAEEVNTV